MFNEGMERKTKETIFPGSFLGTAQGYEDPVVLAGGLETLRANLAVMLQCHLTTRECEAGWQTAEDFSINYDTDANMRKIVGKEISLSTPCHCPTGFTSVQSLLFPHHFAVPFSWHFLGLCRERCHF